MNLERTLINDAKNLATPDDEFRDEFEKSKQDHINTRIEASSKFAQSELNLRVQFSNLAILQTISTHRNPSADEKDTYIPNCKSLLHTPLFLPFFKCLSDYLISSKSLQNINRLKETVAALKDEKAPPLSKHLDTVCFIPEVAAKVPTDLEQKIEETEQTLKKFKQTAKKQLLLRIATVALGVLTFASMPIPPLFAISGLAFLILGIVTIRNRHVDHEQLKLLDLNDFKLKEA